MTSISVKTPDYSQWFSAKNILILAKTIVPLERPSQEKQNGANFSFIAPSSEEKKDTKIISILVKTPYYSPWFLAKNSTKKDTIGKGISRATKWCKFQLHSTFHWRVIYEQQNL